MRSGFKNGPPRVIFNGFGKTLEMEGGLPMADCGRKACREGEGERAKAKGR
jgi:hypothetical protein